MSELKNQILEVLEQQHQKTGGHCGMTIPCLLGKIGVTMEEAREYLVELYKDKSVTVHPSIHRNLIKFNPRKQQG